MTGTVRAHVYLSIEKSLIHYQHIIPAELELEERERERRESESRRVFFKRYTKTGLMGGDERLGHNHVHIYIRSA